MRTRLAVLAVVMLASGCGSKVDAQKVKRESPQAPYLRAIDLKCRELKKLGRAAPAFDCAVLIGEYAWEGNGSGYFGTYEFSQAAFDQAKRGWWGIHGTVVEGNDELWVEDNEVTFWGSGEGASGHEPYPIIFDSSVIGRTISSMYMSYYKDGKSVGGEFQAKVIAIIDGGRNLKLDRRAPHHAEQWQMSIAPDDYTEMCNCTNNFHPPFVDGQPIVGGHDATK